MTAPRRSSLQRSLTAVALVLTSLFAAACSGRAEPATAVLASGLSPAHCVAALDAGTAPDAAVCPAFLMTAITNARAVCRDVGGTLAGAAEGAVWTLDVDRDGAPEFVYEEEGNVTCEGAFSVFSCGSLGCPKLVYANRGGEWREIAGIFFAYAPEHIAVLDAAPGTPAPLRVGCAAPDSCAEHWLFEWNGARYERTHLDVRGFDVDLVATVNGLYPLAAATDVRETPEAGAASVGRYEAGTEVAVVGTATTTTGEHFYVSPCNACESGFVPRTALVLP